MRNKLQMAVTFLLIILIAAPFVASVQAAKTTIPFSTYRELSGGSGGTDANQKTSQDEDKHLLIRWGTTRDLPYSNPTVGTGRIILETVRSITNYEVPPTTPAALQGIAEGHGIYKVKISITSGPHGVGTLEGFAILTWEWDFLASPAEHTQIAAYTLMQGTGDFEGAKLHYETETVRLPSGLYGISTNGELVLP